MDSSYKSMKENEQTDWIEKRMAVRWARWLCQGMDFENPLVSPVYGDFRGLPPIYIQAGDAEILIDMIRELVRRAKVQGVQITLEEWKQMNHVFQAFGPFTPKSREALQRIGEVIQERMG